MNQYQRFTAALSAALLLVLSGCTLGSTTPSPTPTETVSPTPNPYQQEAEAFVRNFTDQYPGYELLDYAVGSPETAPIHVAAVAKDKQSGSSSTLFLVDDTGEAQKVVLGSGSYTVYREEDGITLDGNIIHISFNLSNSTAASLWQIHDFALTVTQEMQDGVPSIQYTTQEDIRTE